MKSRTTRACCWLLLLVVFSCTKVLPVPDEENLDIIGLPSEQSTGLDTVNTIVVDSIEIIECPSPLPYNEIPDPNFVFYSDINDTLISLIGSFQINNVQAADLPLKLVLTNSISADIREYFICQVLEVSYQSGFLMAEAYIPLQDLLLLNSRNLGWVYVKSNFITAGIHFTVE